MSGTDTKKMRSKIFLAVLLLTPILVVTFSTLYFLSGMSPEGTKNIGVFFKSYFDLNDFKNIEGKQYLVPANKNYEKIPVNENIQPIGKVVSLIRDM